MKLQLGFAAFVLAGCATQPTLKPQDSDRRAASQAELALATQTAATLRIGVEYLPPEFDEATAPEVESTVVRTLPRRPTAPTTLVERTLVPEARHTWALSAEDLAAIDDPIARATLHFVDDLVREDERRTEREARLPFLDWKPGDIELGQRLWSEEDLDEAQSEWVGNNSTSLLSRPMRQMLRRFRLVNEVELTIDEFRSSFVPMSEPYQKVHTADRELGRLSVRLHASDLEDPVEIVYIRSGVRVGSSQEIGKLSIDLPLNDNLSLTVRTRRNWLDSESRLRADLAYRHSATTSFRLAAGDDFYFMSTS